MKGTIEGEQQATSGARAKWPARAVLICAICAVITMLAYGLSQTSYWLYGDSADYVLTSNKFRRGYFKQNVQATKEQWLQGQTDTKRVAFMTENGFQFLLHLARGIDKRGPYLVNGFLLPALLVSLAVLLAITGRPDEPRLLAPAGFLLAAFAAPATVNEGAQFYLQLLSVPYRDTPSHLVGVIGLIAAVRSTQTEGRTRNRWLMSSGLLLGLAIWFRVTAVLFIPIAGLVWAWPLLKGFLTQFAWKPLLSTSSLFAAGLFIGLSPFVGQEILEGKALGDTGQTGFMLKEQYAIPDQPEVKTASLSLHNFRYTFFGHEREYPGVWYDYRKMLPPWLWACAIVGFVFSLWRYPMRAALFGGAALLYLLFYGCYIRPVGRYTFTSTLFLLPLCGAWLPALANKFLKTNQQQLLTMGLSVALGALIGGHMGSFDAFGSEAKEVARLEKWIEDEFPDNALIVAHNPMIKSLFDNFAPDAFHTMHHWRKHRRNNNYHMIPKDPEPGTPEVFFVSGYNPEGKHFYSWWREDMLNEYKLEPLPELRLRKGPIARLVAERIRWPTETQLTLGERSPSTHAQPASFLQLNARELPGNARSIPARLTMNQQPIGEPFALQAGANVLPLPATILPGAELGLIADSPLPSIRSWQISERNEIHLPFLYMTDIANVGNWVYPIGFAVKDYPHWQRDWMHRGKKYHSRPLFTLMDQSVIRGVRFPSRHRVLIYYRLGMPPTTAPHYDPGSLRLSYQVHEKKIQHQRYILGASYPAYQQRMQDLMDVIELPGCTPTDLPADIHVRLEAEGHEWHPTLYQITFTGEADFPFPVAPHGEPIPLQWTLRKSGLAKNWKFGRQPLQARYELTTAHQRTAKRR